MNSDFERMKADQLAATSRMDDARAEMQRITAGRMSRTGRCRRSGGTPTG